MDSQRYLDCFASDFARLRTVAASAPDAEVPTCPPWTMTDLVRHVAQVYSHKAATMEHDARQPQPDLTGEDPPAALDRGYDKLLAQFGHRQPSDVTVTWFPPDQTVAFWIRRMAQETVIHRVDAELAAGVESAPIPRDLAVDGVDEVLERFLAFASHHFREDFAGALDDLTGQRVRVETGDSAWLVNLDSKVITLEAADGPADATVRADPETLLRWLWRRAAEDSVTTEGDQSAVDALYTVLKGATQ
ncbi:maleylpyruvate isomerase family mycothiol-dependent enzyme [Actinokineospora xionganensis]|uniref:Maleylpyruvate isomerase family mycothiol-dependent enzyme n=1 Tax=Actinokineospora xionganensis TaxID=2684470 RepID=A0ABR7L287_9PSEU|nr:maleylpyruvate isomerase family mycothiol-dependent enzyme [Actinokineospora xionganensis]MBC6446633.1 maleylpyruvate isomerase family mycothiol-dependent enzyme [Actinokineospora xionganensis]